MPDEFNNDQEDIGGKPESRWVVVAKVSSRLAADYALEALKGHDIPAVIDARAGFLGTSEMALTSVISGKEDQFLILTPDEYYDDAAEVLTLYLAPSLSAGARRRERQTASSRSRRGCQEHRDPDLLLIQSFPQKRVLKL